jgi:hypothetical protein
MFEMFNVLKSAVLKLKPIFYSKLANLSTLQASGLSLNNFFVNDQTVVKSSDFL